MAYTTIPAGGSGLWTTADNGTDYTASLSNPRDSAGADAIIEAIVGGTSAGNPQFKLTVTGGGNSWTAQLNNATSDRFELLDGSSVRMYSSNSGLVIGGGSISALSNNSSLWVSSRAAGGDTEAEIQNASAGNKVVLYISHRSATGAITMTAWGTSTSDTVFGDNAAQHHAITSGKEFRLGTTASTSLILGTNSAKVLTLTAAGSIVPGTAALATTATDGYMYITSCAGAPTGVPTAATGRVALQFDSTNNRIYVYDGAWLSVAVA